MDIPKNYKEIIEKSIQGEWHLLGNRNTPPFLLWLKMLALNSDEMRKIYGTTVRGAVIYKESFTKFYFLSDTFKEVVDSATAILFSENKAKDQLAQVAILQDYAKKKASFFLEEDLGNLSNEELWEKYEEVASCYARPLLYGFLTWCTPVFTDYAKSILRKHFGKIAEFDVDEKTAFGILVTPDEKSPYSEKDEALNRLAIKYKKQVEEIKGNTEDNIKEKYPELNSDISEFLGNYKWIGYDYNGPATSYGEVLKDIRERNIGIDIEKQQKISREDIIDKCGFSPSEKSVFDIFSQLTYVKDMRNSGDDFVHFCLIEYFFTEVGRRFDLTKEAVQFLSPEELEKMLKENKVYSEEYINEKRRCYVATTIDKEETKKYYIGNEAEEFLDKIEKKIDYSDTMEFRGTVACIGKVKARVKIVGTFEELDKIEEGDVLVTHMTSPRFMSAIKKVSAIITNEGGMTCHAAIISREFKIPCIVGTKIATQVLKDGDLVEVDADKGIVRVLEKANNKKIQEYRKLMNRSFPLIFFECWYQGERFGLSEISKNNMFFEPLFIYRKDKGTDVLYNFTDIQQNPNLLVEYFKENNTQLEVITKKQLINYEKLVNTLKNRKKYSLENIKEIFSLSSEMLAVLTSMVVISNNFEENSEIVRISNRTRIKTEDFVFQSIDALLQNAVGLLPEEYKRFTYFLTYSEIAGELPTVQELKQRELGYIYYQGLVHASVDEKKFAQKHNLNIIHDKTTVSSQLEEIRGKSAFNGKIAGKVKIVFEIYDMKKIGLGDVLVTSMTTPDLIAISRDFAAIVTDEGGLLCHAAIIAREMKKPCIIGTKIATQVLKDGDLVEVDADKGVVRIIEKA